MKNSIGFAAIFTDCIGRPVIVNVMCPKLQYRQILRVCPDSWAAVRIAEARWDKAQRLRKLRARARQRKIEASKVYENL